MTIFYWPTIMWNNLSLYSFLYFSFMGGDGGGIDIVCWMLNIDRGSDEGFVGLSWSMLLPTILTHLNSYFEGEYEGLHNTKSRWKVEPLVTRLFFIQNIVMICFQWTVQWWVMSYIIQIRFANPMRNQWP